MASKKAMFTTIGASNHTSEPRADYDYYATDPRAVPLLLEQEEFTPIIYEPACGEGHISKPLEERGYQVICSDIVDRGIGEQRNFLLYDAKNIPYDIITNPPYVHALEFVQKALDIVAQGRKVAMFLKLTFLESKGRKEFFRKNPPRTVYVSSGRLGCAKNGDFKAHSVRAIAYAWYVWEKGYQGDTVLKWIN